MKKFMCLLLSVTMMLAMSLSVGATQTITFNEDGEGTVTTKEDGDDSKDDSDDKKTIESVIESVFGGSSSDDKKGISSDKKGYLALGSDLSSSQLATVLSLLGISADDLGNYEVVYTTNSEEHAALDKYIDSSIIGKRSLSSVLVKPAKSGHGVVVTTHNINYCTNNMYRNALITAGVTDADITVVAPSSISGTAALIGALKAYEKMSGNNVSEKALDTSLNELVTTGQLSDTVGTKSEAEELIAYIKTVVATNDLNTEEEIDAAIRKAMVDLNVKLSEDEVKQIIRLMMKIKAMGIDYSVLAEQADDIYAKYKDDIDAGTFDISKVDLNDPDIMKIIGRTVTKSFSNVGNTIKSFFGTLFGK